MLTNQDMIDDYYSSSNEETSSSSSISTTNLSPITTETIAAIDNNNATTTMAATTTITAPSYHYLSHLHLNHQCADRRHLSSDDLLDDDEIYAMKSVRASKKHLFEEASNDYLMQFKMVRNRNLTFFSLCFSFYFC